MWEPFGNIIELDLQSFDDVEIYFNALKIRKTTLEGEIPDITNLDFVNIDEIRKFKTAKRAEEHAAGRYLLYQMLLRYFPLLEGHLLEILRDANRAPYLKWIKGTYNNTSLPNFSISTSGDYVIVAICNSQYNVGIDLEKLNVKRSENLFDFLSIGSELNYLKTLYNINGDKEINKLWTAKESILKALRVGMSISPTKIKVIGEDLNYKQIIEYKELDLNLKTQILVLNEKYCFSLAYGKIGQQKYSQMRIAGIEPTT